MKRDIGELNVPPRILLGPGPSNVDSRVYRAILAPMLGHLDPEFLRIMDDVQVLLRRLFQTENRLTFPVSGTGSAAMETAMANCLEPGDTAAITVAGHFGARLAEMARRAGAEVIALEAKTLVHGPVGPENTPGPVQDRDADARLLHELDEVGRIAPLSCGIVRRRLVSQRFLGHAACSCRVPDRRYTTRSSIDPGIAIECITFPSTRVARPRIIVYYPRGLAVRAGTRPNRMCVGGNAHPVGGLSTTSHPASVLRRRTNHTKGIAPASGQRI